MVLKIEMVHGLIGLGQRSNIVWHSLARGGIRLRRVETQ
jgi:hypothetical protein